MRTFSSLLGMLLLAGCTNVATQPSSTTASPSLSSVAKIRFPAVPDSGSTIAGLNKKLGELGISERLSENIEIDLTQSRSQLMTRYEELNRLVSKASPGEGLNSEGIYKEACFIGDNKKVAENFAKLTDVWLSDQFQQLAVSTSRPGQLGIKYTETDDGTGHLWLNMKVCK